MDLLWLTVLSLWLTFWHQIKAKRLLLGSFRDTEDLESEDVTLVVHLHCRLAIPGEDHLSIAIGEIHP